MGKFPASVISPGTITPFVLEGICLLVIFTGTILLAVPFVNRTKFKKYLKAIEPSDSPSTTNYPVTLPLPSATPELSVLHSAYPAMVNRSSDESSVNNDENCTPELSEMQENPSSKYHPSPDHRTFVNYNSYRHKLIEETLRKQYSGGYAPGDVILNLIELNTADSGTSVILAKKYDRSFLDHIKIHDLDGVVGLCKSVDSGFPDPLNHFVPRYLRKPSTMETQTETAAHPSEISVAVKPSARPDTPNSCQRIISKRSRETNYFAKSPFVTPINSQTPLIVKTSLKSDPNPSGKGEILNSPGNNVRKLWQLYRRNDARPDVISKTHVEAEEYISRIATNTRYGVSGRRTIQEPGFRSSLKKSRQRGNKFLYNKDRVQVDEKIRDSVRARRSFRDDIIRHLSTSKPTIWNN